MSDRSTELSFGLLMAFICMLAPSTSIAQTPVSSEGNPRKAVQRSEAEDESSSPPTILDSDAERIAAVENLLRSDRARLKSLEEELTRLQEEFDLASQDFTQADAKLAEAKKEGEVPQAVDRIWKSARDRFDLVITRRREVSQQIQTIREKIQLAEAALGELNSAHENDLPAAVPQSVTNGGRNESSGNAGGNSDARESPSPSTGLLGEIFPQLVAPIEPTDEPIERDGGAGPADIGDAEQVIVPSELAEAREDDAEKRQALQTAERRLASILKVEALVKRELESAKSLLVATRSDLAATQLSLSNLQQQIEAQEAADEPTSSLDALRSERDQTQDRVSSAQVDAEAHSARVAELETQLEVIEAAKQAATEDVEKARSAAERAARWLAFQEGPVAPYRIVQWVRDRGHKIVIIILLMLAMWWLSRIVARRVVSELALRSKRGNAVEREMRAETLKRVFQSTASVAILTIGGLALLNESGFDVTVLLGGAAVVGAAIAFGAQNLIKDYFLGFMILVENQYSVGNIVRLGDITGTVEDISLRMTVLRDLEGVVHFIPHSQVSTVSNLTHGWSQVVCDIGVGYGEDVDGVMEVLLDVARELRDDATFGPLMLGEPDMLGVDKFTDSAVIIRFVVKTRPLKQWMVKRELLRRVKKSFDKHGIEIPFPQRTLHIPRLAATASPLQPEVAATLSKREPN